MIKIEDIVLDGKESNSSGRQMPAMTEEEKDILQHHGVIGMRWGKGRKTKVPKQTTAPKANGVDEAARERQFKNEYANRDKMSTRSLQNRVKRLQAEQQFKELVNKPAAERAKAAAAIAEKKRKRNKMLLRTALGIYGNVPMESFGKKGKDLKEILGPSQAIAKAASTSDALKNSAINDETENVLLHYGSKGMRRGIRKQIIAAGGKRDVKLLKKQNTAAIKIYKANKLNYKVAKGNFKSNKNKINKMQYKAARKMYKGAKVSKKAQMEASKIRSQELVDKYLKQYDSSDILLHKGVKGMKWGLKNAASQDGAGNDAAVNQQVDILNQQIAVEKDPKKKAFLEETLSKYKNTNTEDPNATNIRTPEQTHDALVKGANTIKQNIAKETDPSKLAELKKSLQVYNTNITKLNSQMGINKTLAHGFKEQGKYMTINKNDVILHSSTGVELQELHHGFKYESKHQNKKGKWVYVYDDMVKGAKGLLDSNATQKETATGTANVKTYADGTTFADSYDKNSGWGKTFSKAYNKNSKSDANYDRSHRQLVGISTKLTDPNKSNKNFHKGTVSNTATSIVRKKGTIHKTYDNVLKKLGF